jgi:CheY-like chemotaxis protein
MLGQILGQTVEIAHDGSGAVQKAESFQPEVAVLDVGMPRLSGYDACRRIRVQACAKDMVLIAVTGWGEDQAQRAADEAGFDGLLVKSVYPEVVLHS